MNKTDLKKYVEKRIKKLEEARDNSTESIPRIFYAGEMTAYEDILKILEEE